MQPTVEFNPPMLNGVSASKVFLPASPDASLTVFAYLCTQFAHIAADEWQSRFNEGLVYDAQGNQLNTESPFQANSHCFYYRFWHMKCMFLFNIRFYLKMSISWWSINRIF